MINIETSPLTSAELLNSTEVSFTVGIWFLTCTVRLAEVKGVATAKGLNKQAYDQVDQVDQVQRITDSWLLTELHPKTLIMLRIIEPIA